MYITPLRVVIQKSFCFCPVLFFSMFPNTLLHIISLNKRARIKKRPPPNQRPPIRPFQQTRPPLEMVLLLPHFPKW